MGQVIVLFQSAAVALQPQRVEEKPEDEGAYWLGLGNEFHVEIRAACARITQKVVAADLGVTEGTVSNWLACTPGRGFPPPRLVLYLLRHSDELARWVMGRAGFLPPERPHVLDQGERLRRIEGALAANPDVQRAVYDRAFGRAVAS